MTDIRASGAASSNVGSRQLYEAGDQRTTSRHEKNTRQRYKEGEPGSLQPDDTLDKQGIANRLSQEPQRRRRGDGKYDAEAELSKMDPTAPARLHGNAPSRGAQIDADLQHEDELRLQEKGIK
ncbi:hypothetical protein VTN49DRAFT_1134 [Thermomyces lanuginosus]|uniref:uncharacterized protein n=1 Tax=Thermomyces lanuginosus TaxID=5541 RepID=UPI003742CA3D